MIPDGGLIATYAGRMLIVGVLLVLGLIVCTALTVAVMVRKAPPLTTQVDWVTGKREHGVGLWWLGFASFTVAPWLLLGIVLTAIEVYRRMVAAVPLWWLWAGLAAVCALCVWVYRRFAKRLDRAYKPPETVFDDQGSADLPVQPVGWSLPEGTPPGAVR